MLKSILVFSLFFMSCTSQQRAKTLGGNVTIEVPCDHQVFDVTWKEPNSIWFAYQPVTGSWIPVRKIFQESSSFGVLEGKVTFIERRCQN